MDQTGVSQNRYSTGNGQLRDLHREVTDQIVAELETGVRPWVRPWSQTPGLNIPANAVTGRPYSGVNTLLLWATRFRGWQLPRFLTFKQALEAGGCVRKGEHGHRVVFVKGYAREAEEQEEPRRIRFLKHFTVFNVAQCDGLPDKFFAPPKPLNPDRRDADIDEFIAATGAKISEDRDAKEACYQHGYDLVTLPPFEAFRSKAQYYSTLFHELTHWTGHETRLGRRADLQLRFGPLSRAAEELVAELGAAFMCAEFSVDGFVPHAAYLEDYLGLLKSDTKAIFAAASRAQAAVDFLRELLLKEAAA
jgi:antirestriction protein ArdC